VQGEILPLLDVGRIEVRLALLRAVFSGGKDVDVRSAEIDGLVLNIVRMKDGTTNLERFQKTLAENAAPKKEAAKEEKPADLSFLRIDHAALRDGMVSLSDLGGGQPHKLAIQHIDLVVNDLRAGKPLEIVLKAAVLAEKQNLELRVKAAPLPASLTP